MEVTRAQVWGFPEGEKFNTISGKLIGEATTRRGLLQLLGKAKSNHDSYAVRLKNWVWYQGSFNGITFKKSAVAK